MAMRPAATANRPFLLTWSATIVIRNRRLHITLIRKQDAANTSAIAVTSNVWMDPKEVAQRSDTPSFKMNFLLAL